MLGNRIFADGVKKQHHNGPRACSIQIVDDALLVHALELDQSSSASRASSSGTSFNGATLAHLPLSLLLHPRDPLLFVQMNDHSIVFHRKSDAGRDGLLLLFENPSGLQAFVSALEKYMHQVNEDTVSSSTSPKRTAKRSSAVSSASAAKRSSHVKDDPRRQLTPKRGLPSFVKTPASSPAVASSLFISPSPVAPDEASTAGRRFVHFDSASPTNQYRHGFNHEAGTTHQVSSPVASTQTDPVHVPLSSDVAQEKASSTAAASTMGINRRTAAYYPTGDSGLDYPYSPFQERPTSPSVYSYRSDSMAHRTASYQGRMPSASHGASTSGTDRNSQFSAYLDRSGRMQHYMDALEETSQRRASMLEDLFEERDRKRRAQLRKMEHQAADDEIRASVKERFRIDRHHRHDRTGRGGSIDGNRPLPIEEDPLLLRLKQLLRETPAASASLSVYDRFGSVSPTPAENVVQLQTDRGLNRNSLSNGGEGQFLVDQIKQLLAEEYDGFEALRMHTTATHDDNMCSTSHKPSSPAPPAAAVEPFVLGSDLNAAVAAEARLVSTLRYGQVPMPRPVRIPEEASVSSETHTHSLPPDVTTCASPTASFQPARTPLSPSTKVPNVSGTLQLDAPLGTTAAPKDPQIQQPPSGVGTPQSPAVPQQGGTTGSGSAGNSTKQVPVLSEWKELSDKNTGRPYYVHKTSKKTTWNRSDTDLDTAAAVAVAEEPAAPILRKASSSAAAPGPDWITKQDKATGKPYYIHKETKRTTWKISDTLEPEPSSQKEESGNHPTASSVSSAKPQSTSSAAVRETTMASNSSATGWIAKVDPSSGKTFYSNAKIKKTTWNISDTDLVDARNPETSKEAALPPGWKAVHDKATGKTYYVHKETKKTQWTVPNTE